jgi:hypothetical protein
MSNLQVLAYWPHHRQYALAFALLLAFTSFLLLGEEGVAQPIQKDGPLLIKSAPAKGERALWLETSLKRIFPTSPAGSTNLSLLAARNGTASFQACVENRSSQQLKIKCQLSGADDLHRASGGLIWSRCLTLPPRPTRPNSTG